MSVPTPLSMPKRKPVVLPEPPVHKLLVAVDPGDPGKRVTLGTREEVLTVGVHDGVVKTKHLERGQRIRPFVHGQARGSERIVANVTKVEDGEFWRIEWATPHPAQSYKAAYRWFDESLVGTDVQAVHKVPAFVPAHGEPEDH